MKDGLLNFKQWLFLLNILLKNELSREFNEISLSEHFGEMKTLHILFQLYCRKTLRNSACDYIESCLTYQRRSHKPFKYSGFSNPYFFHTPNGLW